MEEPFEFSGTLNVQDFEYVVHEQPAVTVSDEVLQTVAQYHAKARAVAHKVPVYGRSTGVGANKSIDATLDMTEQGMNLLRSHSVQAGEPYSSDEVRAMFVVRLNQLCNPGSAINPDLLTALADLLNSHVIPPLLRTGAVGTADLNALAATALTLTGERTSYPTTPHIAQISSEDALPFISSSAMTIGKQLLNCERLHRILNAEETAYCLILMALGGNVSPFCKPAIGTICINEASQVAQRLHHLIADSTWKSRHIQDAYAMRAYPSVRANALRSLNRLEEQSIALANCAQENPLFVKQPSGQLDVIHHGAFFQAGLAHESDSMAIALAQEGPLLLSRMTMLNNAKYSHLPDFLAPEQNGTSGTMIVEYTAASALGEVYASAAPVCVYSAALSHGEEEDSSFATTSAEKLTRSIDSFENAVSCELFMALRAAFMGDVDRTLSDASPLRAALDLARKHLEQQGNDKDFSEDVLITRSLIPQFADI